MATRIITDPFNGRFEWQDGDNHRLVGRWETDKNRIWLEKLKWERHPGNSRKKGAAYNCNCPFDIAVDLAKLSLSFSERDDRGESPIDISEAEIAAVSRAAKEIVAAIRDSALQPQTIKVKS